MSSANGLVNKPQVTMRSLLRELAALMRQQRQQVESIDGLAANATDHASAPAARLRTMRGAAGPVRGGAMPAHYYRNESPPGN